MGKIKLTVGDITDFDGDAIVNAANNHLILGSGVAGAIRVKGGPTIQEECNEIGIIKVGEAALTGAGNLKAKYVIHAAAMGDEPVTENSLRNSVVNSLRRADENGIKTIAFPAIGTGIGGFSIKRCAEIMVEEINNYLASGESSIELVTIALFRADDYEVFNEVLQRAERMT